MLPWMTNTFHDDDEFFVAPSSSQHGSTSSDAKNCKSVRPLITFETIREAITIKRIVKAVGFIIYLIIGFIFYGYYEQWHPFKTLFFTVVTCTSVGYYDHPTNDDSRLFTIFYAIIGVYIVFFYVSKEISKSFSAGLRYLRNLPSAHNEHDTIVDKQKKIVLFFIGIMIIFILISGGIFVALEPDWSYIEGVYFAVQTTTVS